jgi:flagellar biosynthetic protein FliO
MAEGMLFVRAVGALLFVLFLVLLAAMVLKRITNRDENWPVVKVISRQKIGRNAELVVVDYNKRRLLLGVTDGGVSLLESGAID